MAAAVLTLARAGFFLWLQLPPPLLARDVVAAAEANGVTAMAGERCSPTGPAGLLVQDRLRLCFAFLPVEELIEGQSESVFLPFSKPWVVQNDIYIYIYSFIFEYNIWTSSGMQS